MLASSILMIRPASFGYNPETAVSNAFQTSRETGVAAQERALEEFDAFSERLQLAGIDVTVVQDEQDPYTPDSIFPNNWLSTHPNGKVFLYPMEVPSRRLERKPAVLEAIKSRFEVTEVIDLSFFENEGKFLEGTGSMVLDEVTRTAFACCSGRTNVEVLEYFCEIADFHPLTFTAVDLHQKPVYHTNVMMCLGERFGVICMDSIPDQKEKTRVINELKNSGRELIAISQEQLSSFAGNMLQLEATGRKVIVMSEQARNSLVPEQLKVLKKYGDIVSADLRTIESCGGGSARCMIAELKLPKMVVKR
ncbi:citrulline utilization hydrolase CtlX [Pedobacter sp. SYSU D00535]|uniref:citrulline utilization hydrolase CtlX n=1 Tax=Pedobacter sp. SYSU D00535 TaxID=2810308 RepID=UPI001A974661|nr:arginine deiminase-related protein [Pedobacter sp. SYSU D00535]